MIRIVVVDERRLVADSLAGALSLVPGFEIKGRIYDSRRVNPVAARLHPSAVVLGGISSQGGGPLEVASLLWDEAPDIGIICILASFPRQAMDVAASRSICVVLEKAPLAQLTHAIRESALGSTVGSCVDRKINSREKEVLLLTVDGAPLKEIAEALHLSPGTVRNIASGVIGKLGARNRFDAVRIARGRGWL